MITRGSTLVVSATARIPLWLGATSCRLLGGAAIWDFATGRISRAECVERKHDVKKRLKVP